MSSQPTEKVFVSWTGELGKEIAECLSEEKIGMLSFARLEPWLSENITKGASWFQETQAALESAKYGVVCLMPGSSKRPWINFEVGFLFGRLRNCKLVTFGETLANPLAQLQRMNGMEVEDWVTLLVEMTTGLRTREECRSWAQSAFPRIKEIFDRRDSFPHKYLMQMDQTVGEIQQVIDEIKKNSPARTNICFQQVILNSFQGVKEQGLNLNPSLYNAPASQYPQYLIALQRNLNPVVKAVALVDIEEEFWQQTYGKEILRTSNEMSSRIFVFTSEKQLTQMSETLQNHASCYKVYVISYAQLSKEFSLYTKDFSIIETLDGKLLAEYDKSRELIQFNADLRIISEHERVMEKIIKNAIFLPRQRMSDDEFKHLKESVFNPTSLDVYDRKTIEMSLYIDVEDYDQHEENHAYYREMMERMAEIFSRRFPSSSEPCRVLEFGAGTGIFTSRLAELDSINEIVAVEIDWHCYKKLEYKFRDQKNRVKVLHEDSRKFDPPGKFDFIFSSFADHHIRERDKARYFKNVKRNLKPGALLIVGDEFLREHDSDDEADRRMALEAYHNHIIEKARDIGDEILVQLESQALQSGLAKVGDFKVSCNRYKELLRQAGFVIEEEDLVGPESQSNQIGGVYVYTIRHPVS
jgi:SAM-dependent methyltransferase